MTKLLVPAATGPMLEGPRYPGHDLPMRPGEQLPARPGWPRLARAGGIGKSGVLIYNASDDGLQNAPVPLISIGDQRGANAPTDEDASPIIVTLAPPRVIPIAYADLTPNGQNQSGEYNNIGMRDAGNFPGTGGPIVWPLLEAIIEWGTGGIASEARVDFSNGLTVNLSASWLRVHAAAVPSARSGVVGTSAAYWLAAFVSPGWTQPGRAQKTVCVGALDVNEESGVFSVPRFAKRAYLVAADAGATPQVTVGTLRFWRSPDGQVGGNCAGNFFVSGAQPQAFEIPNAGLYFSVLSGTPGTDVPFSVIFDLAI